MEYGTKVMILPSPTSSGSIGSLTKTIGIANELKLRGCVVSFVMGGVLGAFLKDNHYQVYDYPIPSMIGDLRSIQNAVDFIEWSGMADDTFIEASVDAEIKAINDFKPDVIFAEARPSASISARVKGIPTIMIASWSYSPMNPIYENENGRLTSGFNRILKNYGLSCIENVVELFYSFADVKIAPTISELEPELKEEKGIVYTGYILDMDNTKKMEDWYYEWEKLPQIFIYLSVGALSPQLYIDTIVDTFCDMPYRVLCSCGFHYNLGELPENLSNIHFEKYVPAPLIMKDTSLIIFHGGQDTMLTSLANGIPSLTIPGNHYERDYNATNLMNLNVSKKLPVISFRRSRLLQEVANILTEPYISNAKKLSEVLKEYGGTKLCAEILIQTATK